MNSTASSPLVARPPIGRRGRTRSSMRTQIFTAERRVLLTADSSGGFAITQRRLGRHSRRVRRSTSCTASRRGIGLKQRLPLACSWAREIRSLRRWSITLAAIWVVAVVIVSIQDAAHHPNNLATFRTSWDNLRAGRDLYTLNPTHQDYFKYSPTFALLFAPFA